MHHSLHRLTDGDSVQITTPETDGNWAALVQPIPEPSSVTLLGLGGLLLLPRRRRLHGSN